MSGEFMRCLCREIGPRFDLAADLGVSRPEVHTIMADPLLTSDEDKMFKVGQNVADLPLLSRFHYVWDQDWSEQKWHWNNCGSHQLKLLAEGCFFFSSFPDTYWLCWRWAMTFIKPFCFAVRLLLLLFCFVLSYHDCLPVFRKEEIRTHKQWKLSGFLIRQGQNECMFVANFVFSKQADYDTSYSTWITTQRTKK